LVKSTQSGGNLIQDARPTVQLTDAESLCAFVRFGDPKGRIWNLVEKADDPEVRKIAEYEAAHCPAFFYSPPGVAHAIVRLCRIVRHEPGKTN
jgi:hypothetical protein